MSYKHDCYSLPIGWQLVSSGGDCFYKWYSKMGVFKSPVIEDLKTLPKKYVTIPCP
jgi:hypothetical protein